MFFRWVTQQSLLFYTLVLQVTVRPDGGGQTQVVLLTITALNLELLIFDSVYQCPMHHFGMSSKLICSLIMVPSFDTF